MNWSKELWFALFIGWFYHLAADGLLSGSSALELSFLNTTLRTWAEQIVYGPLG